jgi:acyl carrier protein
MNVSLTELRSAFVETLNLEDASAVDDSEYAVTPGWDSIAHMALVAELEDRFDVMLDTDDVIDMSSFRKSMEILEKHGVTFV